MKFSKLRGLMIEAGYRHDEIGKKIGLSKVTFSTRMTGKIPFTLEEAYKIMDVLHIPEEQFTYYFPRGGVTKNA